MCPPTLRPPTLGRAFAWISGFAAAIALAACDITAPIPSGARPFEPLANYAAWWSMVERCSGHSAPMRSIDWYMVPGRSFTAPTGLEVAALHQAGRITIAGDLTRDGRVVRHEMLHAIVGRGAHGAVHPAEYFIDRCGGYVDCNEACLETSDGPTQLPAGTPTVSPNALDVWVEADSVASLSAFGGLGYTSIRVSARNPLGHGVVVTTPLSAYTRSFAIDLLPPFAIRTGQRRAIPYGSHESFFRAGQVKTYVFDVYLPDSSKSVGDWSVGGGFGTQWAAENVKFRVTR